MKDLKKKKDFEVLKNENFSVLMIWANGCGVCEQAKPQYEGLDSKFDYDFYKMELGKESFEFYSQFEEKTQVARIPSVDEDGDPILDARGNQMSQVLRDENGEVVKNVPIAVPKYYVFHGDAADEENPYGLLGKVEGHNLPQLESILANLKDLEEQEASEQGEQDGEA